MPEQRQRDPQCSVMVDALRCALFAVWYPNHSRHGYCWLHNEQGDMLKGDALKQQLIDIRDNRERYIEERRQASRSYRAG